MVYASSRVFQRVNSLVRHLLRKVQQRQTLPTLTVLIANCRATSCHTKVQAHILSRARLPPRYHPLQTLRPILPQQATAKARAIDQKQSTARE